MNTTEKKINLALRAAGCDGYTARVDASTDWQVEDDSLAILLHGVETSWKLQLGSGYCGVNEYGYKDGHLDWMRDHGTYRSQKQAVARLCGLLRSTATA